MNRKLSTGCELSTASLKKREAEKRKSPLTPLREKGKGKEQDGVSCETCFSKTARAHVRRKLPCACSFSEAGAAAAEIVGNCFPRGAKDFALWAWYCRHFDRRRIVERAYYYASCERQGEVRDGVTAFQAWLGKEFGERGGAR